MPIEQRVISQPRPITPAKPKISARDRSAPSAPEPVEEKKKSMLPIILGTIVGVLVVVGAAFWFFVKPLLATDPAAAADVPGAVHTVESMNINLTDGHYLRLGFAVQLTEKAEEIEPARIIDTALELYSGQKFEEVLEPAVRESLKAQLANSLDEIYEGEVMDVYFTDYVAQ